MKQKTVDDVRAFNRWYTEVIGLLDRYILHSAFNLPEARILYELYHRNGIQAGELTTMLALDKGYLSRLLDAFTKKGLIVRRRSAEDGRVQHIFLTAKGRKAFEGLNEASDKQVKELLASLPEEDGERLVYHMNEIKKIIKHGNLS